VKSENEEGFEEEVEGEDEEDESDGDKEFMRT